MEMIDIYIQHVILCVENLHDFLLNRADLNFLQARKFANSEVNVHNVVTSPQRLQFAQRKSPKPMALVASTPPTAEDFVFSVDGDACGRKDEAVVNRPS